MNADIPSPIDLRRMDDAREWADTAMTKRPWRIEFFRLFSDAVGRLAQGRAIRVLELGSGPGFLAKHMLEALPAIEYVALDFSPAMHALAVQRLGALAERVRFVERSFRDPSWPQGLGRFDAVVTLQAVHELRHKRHAAGLHAQARQVLVPGGSYLVCDHFSGEDGMSNDQLYMSVAEQRTAIEQAGFENVRQELVKGTLVLHHATGPFDQEDAAGSSSGPAQP